MPGIASNSTMELPKIPVPVNKFIPYISRTEKSIREAVEPFRIYESKLREIYAQDRSNQALADPNANLISVYAGYQDKVKICARTLEAESREEKDKYLLALPAKDRKPNNAPAITESLKDFQNNFNIFSESSLVDMDWNNVVAAGSSAVTALLPVNAPHNESKRALREYYHEKLAPASDVDLFLYGLTEQEALEKIKQIEASVRDSILYETTVIRTKYAITIASQYPCRHVQIVLRIYKDISEILTGFDVDSSCVAYNGSQVYASPRAIAAFMTQTNTIDLSRRSPSYENRLSKYSHRGFEVFCPTLDRSRIDPTIFERSFGRVQGLARVLVLEKLPMPMDRDNYLAKRREERGRPALPWQARHRQAFHGNIKEQQPDDVAEWVEEDEVSNYHTFTVPYGPKFYAKKIEKLLFTKDLLLNAEWNKPKDREVNLHRHPAFFGHVQDVIEDCCGSCPHPTNEDETLVAEKEAEIYIKGRVCFITDHPGRQQIGSFNPLTDDDWTEMAYVGNTARLCQAIVDGDLQHVKDWLNGANTDVNRRDHAGRTPLHLATLCSTTEIVQCLIDHGARLVARLVDGQTALHIASRRGNAQMVKALLVKSEQNEDEEEEKQEKRREEVRARCRVKEMEVEKDNIPAADADVEMIDDDDDVSLGSQDTDEEMTQGSFVRIKTTEEALPEDDLNTEDPDVYDVNVVAWDYPTSPLHLAIMGGHIQVVETLVAIFGADVLLPVKIKDDYSREPRAAILTLVLAAKFSSDATAMTKQLLNNGATSLQADMNENTALQFIVNESEFRALEILLKYDEPAAKAAVSHLTLDGSENCFSVKSALLLAIANRDEEISLGLLSSGAPPVITLGSFTRAFQRKFEGASKDPNWMTGLMSQFVNQPIVLAVQNDMPKLADKLLNDSDPNIINRQGLGFLAGHNFCPGWASINDAKSLIELVRGRIEELKKALTIESPKELPQPESLQSDEHYLAHLRPNSYSYWLAYGDLKRAKLVAHSMEIAYNRKVEENREIQDELERPTEKTAAIEDALEKFEHLERRLLSLGAKTFLELHPRFKLDEMGINTYLKRNEKEYDLSYQTELKFMVPDIDERTSKGYQMLFEAAWDGDTDKVKELTMAPWKLANAIGNNLEEGTETPSIGIPPLKIATQDQRGFSPYSLAVLKGHHKLASVIVEIATVQYRPREYEPKYRYSLQPLNEGDEAERSEYDEDEVNIYAQLVDDRYTIDNLASLGETMDSRVSPQTMVDWECDVWRFFDNIDQAKRAGVCTPSQEPPISTPYGNSNVQLYSQNHLGRVLAYEMPKESSLIINYAVGRNDVGMVKFLLKTANDLIQRQQDENGNLSMIYRVRKDIFDQAARLGRTEILGELIERTGAELPINRMVEESGVEIKEQPKYYQGLTVYGRKRKDWADRSRGIMSYHNIESDTPPLLCVAFENNVDSTEFFIGDAPLRRYQRFINIHRNDKAIMALDNKAGGIKRIIVDWLRARSHLAVHASVLAGPLKDDPTKQLRFILNAMPQALDGVSCNGFTPLHMAFQFRRYAAAKYLIQQGADQAARDKFAENVLHHYVRNHTFPHAITYGLFISLLDPTLPSDLFLQRSTSEAGSYTPLALFLRLRSKIDSKNLDRVKLILKYSKGLDLEIMDGSGDYPLHYAVRQGWTTLAKLFIEQNPALLYRENAVGMTPVDVIDTAFLRWKVDNPPKAPCPSNRLIQLPDMSRDVLVAKEDNPDTNGLKNTWKAVVQATEKYPGKRKLVSLFDSNEVAKRLANAETGKRRWSRRYRQYDVGSEANMWDEVDDWMEKADEFEKYDLIKTLRDMGVEEEAA